MAAKQLGDGGSDGVRVPGKIAFGSGTPATPGTVTAIGTTVVTQADTSGVYGFDSKTAAEAFVAAVRSIQDKLNELGIVLEG